MKTGNVCISALVAALGTLAFASTAAASSHREAPAIANDPAADNTDMWAWSDGDFAGGSNKLVVVAAYNPLDEPAGGPNFHKFSDDVRYEIHVARGGASLGDVVWYGIQFKTSALAVVAAGPTPFSPSTPLAPDPVDGSGAHLSGVEFFSQISGQTQSYTVTAHKFDGTTEVIATNVPVAPPNIGPATNAVPYAALYGMKAGDSYETTFTKAPFLSALTGAPVGGSVWAGPRDDGFYVDLGGIFDLANLHSFVKPTPDPRDNVAGYNCQAVSLEIPWKSIPTQDATDPFNDRVGVWASASRRKISILRNDGSTQNVGPWVQVSRQGLPLINEAVIGLQDKDKYNRTIPKYDVLNFAPYFLNPVLVRDARAVGIYKAFGIDPTKFDPGSGAVDLTTNRLDIIATINILDLGGGFPLVNAAVTEGITGDVIRVDPRAVDAACASSGFMTCDSTKGPPVPAGFFPNGRALGDSVVGAGPVGLNQESDVTDIEVTLLALGAATVLGTYGSGKPSPLADGVNSNDANYRTSTPYLPAPWEGWSQGHGKAAP